jgi:hypothetical protein
MSGIKMTTGLACGHPVVSAGWKPRLGSYLSCLRCQGQREVVSVTTEPDRRPVRKRAASPAELPGQAMLPWFETGTEQAS